MTYGARRYPAFLGEEVGETAKIAREHGATMNGALDRLRPITGSHSLTANSHRMFIVRCAEFAGFATSSKGRRLT